MGHRKKILRTLKIMVAVGLLTVLAQPDQRDLASWRRHCMDRIHTMRGLREVRSHDAVAGLPFRLLKDYAGLGVEPPRLPNRIAFATIFLDKDLIGPFSATAKQAHVASARG